MTCIYSHVFFFLQRHALIHDVDDSSDEFAMDNEAYLLHLGWIMRTFKT
jgi:hypothetical protein